MRFAAIISITLLALAGCNKEIHEAKLPDSLPPVASAPTPPQP